VQPDQTNSEFFTVGSLFAGIGGFDLGLEMTGRFRTVWQVEIDPYCNQILAKHWPDVTRYSDVKEINPDQLERVDLICGGFPCFPAETLITTVDGFVPIAEIKPGDAVLTHLNRFKQVAAIGKRKADSYLKLKFRGLPELRTTANHPFWAIGREKKWDNTIRQYQWNYGEPEWVNAGDLTSDHLVGLPKDAEDVHLDKETESFWYLVGRYLGDGWIANYPRKSNVPRGNRGSRVTSKMWKAIICTGHDDADQLAAAIKAAGFHATPSYERTVVKFHISSKPFVKFLKMFGRGAPGKRLPGMVFHLPKTKRLALFKGWIDADGYYRENWCAGTTVSKHMAFGLARLARSIYDRNVSLKKVKVKPKTIIEGRIVNQRPQYQLRVTLELKKRQDSIDRDGFIWTPLIRSEEVNEQLTVYNMEVQDDESYCANTIAVHNCQPASQAGKQKGIHDERWLWPEFIRIVRSVKPRWILVENVPGLRSVNSGRAFGEVVGDLASCGYCVEWDSVPAGAVGAPHIRDRVWLVAYAQHSDEQSGGPAAVREYMADAFGPGAEAMADADGRQQERSQPDGDPAQPGQQAPLRDNLGGCYPPVFDGRPLERWDWGADPGGLPPEAESFVGRMAYDVPNRVDRLRCLGNAVVPAVVYEIATRIIAAHVPDPHV